MDKFFNAFGLGVAVLLASTLASQSRVAVVETASSVRVPGAMTVTDPIALQGNAAVREIEHDAEISAREARPVELKELTL